MEKKANVVPVSTAGEYLKDQVKLRIGLIGIGNAGNQVVNSAYKEGFTEVFAINSSERDLSDSNVNASIPSFLVGDEARGAGKNREKAKELFKINGKKLFAVPAFDHIVRNSDILFVIGSTAGGTGSGIGPDMAYLLANSYPHKIVIFYGILPKLSDSITAQNNCINCLHEINSMNIPFMLTDLSFWENIPNDIAYVECAKHTIECINVIKGKYLYETVNNSIDENDMRTIVGESGYLSVYQVDRITSVQVDQETIQSLMIKRIKKSPSVMIQKDEIIKQLGVIVNCPDEIMEAAKTGNYSELTDFIGMPLGVFENYTVTNGSVGQFITILSGMNLPYSRLQQCIQIIEQHEEKLKRVKKIDLSNEVDRFDFLNSTNVADKLVNSAKVKEDSNKQGVLDSFFK